MISNALASRPEDEEVLLFLPGETLTLKGWLGYVFESDVLTPSDGWHFAIADEALTSDARLALGIDGPGRKLGSEIQLVVNGFIQASGYIDALECSYGRGEGAVWQIHGRDRLAQAVDAHIDPTKKFNEGLTLDAFLRQVFGPFGFEREDQFLIDNTANRNAKSGIRGIPTTKGGRKKGPRPLKSFVLHQLKPYPNEGVHRFASRVAERHGLGIWCSGDGEKLIIAKPDFDQEPSYRLVRDRKGTSDMISCTVRLDMSDQPTLIVADGYGGSSEFGKSRLRAIVANPAFPTADPAHIEPYKRYQDAQRIDDLRAVAFPVALPRARPIFLHDDESKTPDQLANFVKRELSLLLRKSLAVECVVRGHGQVVDGVFRPWCTDAIVDFQDDISGLKESLYVARRRFEKSRSAGTTTHLSLIRKHTIQL